MSRDRSALLQHCFLFLSAILLLGVGPSQAGPVLCLYYDGMEGGRVSQILSDRRFPASPSAAYPFLAGLARVERGGDNWGSWTRGYLEAPQTGEYTFQLLTDDQAEFWLSSSHETFQVRKMVENTNSTDGIPKQLSAPVSLVRGGKYYFEFYHKEGAGLDYFRVAWRLPDGTIENPIPAHRLSPVPVDAKYKAVDKAPQFISRYFDQPVATLTNMEVVAGTNLLLAPAIEASQPVQFQWFKNGKPIPGESLGCLNLTNIQITQSGEKYSLTASNALGVATNEAVLTVVPDRSPPQLISAVSSGVPNTLVVHFSEALDPSSILAQNFELVPAASISRATLTSPETVVLRTAPLQGGKSYRVKARGVRDASRQNAIPDGPGTPVNEGLLVWLDFESKDASDLVPDLSGNFNAASLMNGAKLSPEGVFGSCLQLDGVDDHAILPAGFKSFTNGLTVSFWAMPTRTAPWGRFIDFGNGPFRENMVVTRYSKTSNLAIEIHRGGKKRAKGLLPNGLENKRWQHLAVTMEPSGEVTFYKDGKPAAQGLSQLPLQVERTINLIGKSNWDGDEHYQGFIDDLRIYERPLGPEKIRAVAGSELR